MKLIICTKNEFIINGIKETKLFDVCTQEIWFLDNSILAAIGKVSLDREELLITYATSNSSCSSSSYRRSSSMITFYHIFVIAKLMYYYNHQLHEYIIPVICITICACMYVV